MRDLSVLPSYTSQLLRKVFLLPTMDIDLLIEPQGSALTKQSSTSVAPTPAYLMSRPASTTSMQGEPLPPILSLHQQPTSPSPLKLRPLCSLVPAQTLQGSPAASQISIHLARKRPEQSKWATEEESLPRSNGLSRPQKIKRASSQTSLGEESPAKKQSKWTLEEDNLTIKLRGQGMKWDDVAKRLPGRSSLSCRLRYQNYLEKRAVWDEEKKNTLARLYARYVNICLLSARCAILNNTSRLMLTIGCRFKEEMWQKLATEMGTPWRSAESMHWQLGEQAMAARANAPVFQLHSSATRSIAPSDRDGVLLPLCPTPTSHSSIKEGKLTWVDAA
jgi:hypothetical protein